MKIVGFEANNGVRLGVVEGDNVIDLQAVDAKVPNDLGESCARSNGDLEAARPLSPKKAPASARLPLAGLKFALPVAHPGKIICLGLNYLDHVKEGPQKDNIPKFQSIFFRMLTSLTPHLQPLHAAEEVDPVRLRRRVGRDHRQARQASDVGQCHRLHRRLCLRQ